MLVLTPLITLCVSCSKALAITIRYLKEFGLQHAFQLTKYFTHFSSHGHMIINGNTLVNLEIYRNSTTLSEHGSLFSILNHTSTSFGRRLLKKWVGRPLIDIRYSISIIVKTYLSVLISLFDLDRLLVG